MVCLKEQVTVDLDLPSVTPWANKCGVKLCVIKMSEYDNDSSSMLNMFIYKMASSHIFEGLSLLS